jgi:NADH-quinone oxidoreductase subunit F
MLRTMCGHLFQAYCAFAPGAATPVLGLVEDFVEEIQEHISQKKCPFKT